MGLHELHIAPEGQREVGHHCQQGQGQVGHSLAVGHLRAQAEVTQDKGPGLEWEQTSGSVNSNLISLLATTGDTHKYKNDK